MFAPAELLKAMHVPPRGLQRDRTMSKGSVKWKIEIADLV